MKKPAVFQRFPCGFLILADGAWYCRGAGVRRSHVMVKRLVPFLPSWVLLRRSPVVDSSYAFLLEIIWPRSGLRKRDEPVIMSYWVYYDGCAPCRLILDFSGSAVQHDLY